MQKPMSLQVKAEDTYVNRSWYPLGCIVVNIGGNKKEVAKWGLHPLIHTLLKFNLAQDIDWCQGEKKKTPIDSTTLKPMGE